MIHSASNGVPESGSGSSRSDAPPPIAQKRRLPHDSMNSGTFDKSKITRHDSRQHLPPPKWRRPARSEVYRRDDRQIDYKFKSFPPKKTFPPPQRRPSVPYERLIDHRNSETNFKPRLSYDENAERKVNLDLKEEKHKEEKPKEDPVIKFRDERRPEVEEIRKKPRRFSKKPGEEFQSLLSGQLNIEKSEPDSNDLIVPEPQTNVEPEINLEKPIHKPRHEKPAQQLDTKEKETNLEISAPSIKIPLITKQLSNETMDLDVINSLTESVMQMSEPEFKLTRVPESLKAEFLPQESRDIERVNMELESLGVSAVTNYNPRVFDSPKLSDNVVKEVVIDCLRSLYQTQQRTQEFHNLQLHWKEECAMLDSESERIKSALESNNNAVKKQRQASNDAEPKRSRDRNRRAFGDIVRSEGAFFEILATLEAENAMDPLVRARQTSAKIPNQCQDPEEAMHFVSHNSKVVDKQTLLNRLKVDAVDDFTSEQHELFVQAYQKTPKQFGKISDIVGRTFNECVMHYYRTKKQVDYKRILLNKSKRKRGRKPKKKLEEEAAENTGSSEIMEPSTPLRRDTESTVSPEAPNSTPSQAPPPLPACDTTIDQPLSDLPIAPTPKAKPQTFSKSSLMHILQSNPNENIKPALQKPDINVWNPVEFRKLESLVEKYGLDYKQLSASIGRPEDDVRAFIKSHKNTFDQIISLREHSSNLGPHMGPPTGFFHPRTSPLPQVMYAQPPPQPQQYHHHQQQQPFTPFPQPPYQPFTIPAYPHTLPPPPPPPPQPPQPPQPLPPQPATPSTQYAPVHHPQQPHMQQQYSINTGFRTPTLNPVLPVRFPTSLWLVPPPPLPLSKSPHELRESVRDYYESHEVPNFPEVYERTRLE